MYHNLKLPYALLITLCFAVTSCGNDDSSPSIIQGNENSDSISSYNTTVSDNVDSDEEIVLDTPPIANEPTEIEDLPIESDITGDLTSTDDEEWLAARGWTNVAVANPMQGIASISFEVRALSDNVNGVVAITNGPASEWDDLALIFRMFNNGLIDARDGDTYASEMELSYEANEVYFVEMLADFNSQLYDVFVTYPSGQRFPVRLSANFRSSQPISSADQLVLYEATQDALEVTNFTVDYNTESILTPIEEDTTPVEEVSPEPTQPNVPPALASPGSSILDVDFQNHPGGEYTLPQMDSDFNWVGNWTNGLGQGRTNIETESGNKFLRLLFEQGTRGHVQWQADLGDTYEELYLRYRVRFVGSNFDFRDGGKLPGLAGGTAPTGGDVSDDGRGFSARFMWRNTSSNPDPYFTQYMYDMDKTSGTGRHLTLGASPIYVQTDRWYTIVSRIVMNTPGQADGKIEAWLDGVKVMNESDARLRSSNEYGIDILYFSTFFGGSNSSTYQTSKDEYIDYDDFTVSTDPLF